MLSLALISALSAAIAVVAAWRTFRPAWRVLQTHVSSAEEMLGRSDSRFLIPRASSVIEKLSERRAFERLAQTHALTGLPTREPLLRRMEHDRTGTLALLALPDLDRLSTFDPQLSQQVLKTSVARLTAMIAPSRFVAQVDRSHLAIWIAGEEPDVQRELDALVYALSDRIAAGGQDILPEILLRTASVVDGEPAPAAVLARTIASFSAPSAAPGDGHGIEAATRERFQLEQDLRQAVANGELALQYQPLVDAGEGLVSGAEALIRWHRPEHGLVPPSFFVPVMEAAGLSGEIGLWALNAAVRQVGAWRAAGLPPWRVAVNVSGHQLEDEELCRLVERTLARHSAEPGMLELELTESVAMADKERAAELLQGLHAFGVRIAIDDFGTGYSSLSALRSLPFDKIKIDREFVTDVHLRPDSQAICQSVLTLGRGLGIQVLAEGVESAAEYLWLRRQGCRHFQGYYFSPPLDEAAFVSFARDPRRLARLLEPAAEAFPSKIRKSA